MMSNRYNRKFLFRSIALWFCFLIIAFANGAFREIFLIRKMKMAPLLANQLSCLSGAILFTWTLFMFWKKLGINRLSHSVVVGIGWFISTALFETFILNRKMTWAEIAQTYHVGAGEYWLLVLIWIGLMPILFYSLFRTKDVVT